MRIFHLFLPAVMHAHFANAGLEDPTEQMLARCQGVYDYGAHVAQMSNNEGLATNLLFRSSRVVSSLFMLLETDGVVAGEKVREVRNIQATIKSRLDSGQAEIFGELQRCDQESMSIITDIRASGKTLWGKDFDSIQEEVFQTTRQKIGLD